MIYGPYQVKEKLRT